VSTITADITRCFYLHCTNNEQGSAQSATTVYCIFTGLPAVANSYDINWCHSISVTYRHGQNFVLVDLPKQMMYEGAWIY